MVLSPLPPSHVCFRYPFGKLRAWGHTTHVLHAIRIYTEMTQLAQTFASFLASSINMWTVLCSFDVFNLKSVKQRGRDSAGRRGPFPNWQARESALCLLLVNRQEGILSLVSPPGHWLTSSHSRCTLTFAKSDFSHVSEHCPRGTKLLNSVSWEHLPVTSPVPQWYCITSHLRLITICPRLLNLEDIRYHSSSSSCSVYHCNHSHPSLRCWP